MRRYNEKKTQIEKSKQMFDQIVHLPLMNLIYFLHDGKKFVFRDWLMLNQAVNEELGYNSGGIRGITAEVNNNVFRALVEKDFKPGWLTMSQNDEKSLEMHKKTFKREKKRYCIAGFIFKTILENTENWGIVLQALQYH